MITWYQHVQVTRSGWRHLNMLVWGNGASDGTGWCESALPEQVLGGVADGSSCGRSSAHVGDPLQSVDGVVFGRVVVQAEL